MNIEELKKELHKLINTYRDRVSGHADFGTLFFSAKNDGADHTYHAEYTFGVGNHKFVLKRYYNRIEEEGDLTTELATSIDICLGGIEAWCKYHDTVS